MSAVTETTITETTILENPLQARLQQVKQRIADYELEYAREAGSVQLLAVSKTQAAARVQEAFTLGQLRFGENYLQEALQKMQELAGLPIEWHFIGPIQSNKTRDIASHFDWVHSVDRLKIAQRLSEQRPVARGPLNVLIQVNLSNEDSKSGCALAELGPLATAMATLPMLALRGLMAIPAPAASLTAQRLVFRQLAEARAGLQASGHHACTELSMGMSADFEAAIAEGATLVRIGSDIFGARQ